MSYTTDTTLIVTSDVITTKTIKSIISGMYAKVVKFVQDGDCGWAKVQEFDGESKWVFVATTDAAHLMTGGSI